MTPPRATATMTRVSARRAIALALTCTLIAASAAGEETQMAVATGTFEVNMTPADAADDRDGVTLGRFALDKRFAGGLSGTSTGALLTANSATEGSAGYVAMERFAGSLDGRGGAFVLQHSGTMQGGTQRLSITIVPDSGTGELAGVAGHMDLQIDDGVHAYELYYVFESEND